jgi:ferredoxin-NADP reductase
VSGGCRPRLLPLFGDPSCAPAELEEVVPLTSGIRAFRLRAREGLSAPHGAGQHVLVEGFIGGYWVKRSYTLSSAKAASGLYEISVKLLPRGVFSPWLFERKPGDRGLRISAPRGDALPLGKLVCLVAGIGVTPALALWRQLAASSKGAAPAGFIHYSAHTAAQAAWLAELQSLAARHPGLLLTLRETSREGRLSRNDLRALAARFPESSFFLCGPETYLDEIRAALLAAGVAPNRIHEERFTPAGAPVAKPVPFWRRLFRTNRT